MPENPPVAPSPRMPTHPGAILREDVLPALGLPVSRVAAHLRVTRQQLHRLLAEETGVSPAMALRLGKFLGNGPAFWLRMQHAVDLRKAEAGIRGELDSIPTMRS